MSNRPSRKEFFIKSMLAAAAVYPGLPAWAATTKALTGGKDDHGGKADNAAQGKICVFSKHLHWANYQEMARVAAEIGFDGIDLTVRPEGHVLPEKVAEDLPKAVDAVRKAGLDVYMLTTAINDPKHPHTEAILKSAGKLGIGYYRTGWLPYQDDLSIDKNLEKFKSTFNQLANLNKRYNIHGAYQNHSGTNLGASLWDLWMLLKDSDPRWIGCQYDIRHATVEGANSWPIGLKLLQSHIRTIDIKDFHWVSKEDKWQIENVPLGEGMVNFKQYFELIRKYKIAGPISLHFEYPLGGAGAGSKTLTISKEELITAMRKDLTTLRTWLKPAI